MKIIFVPARIIEIQYTQLRQQYGLMRPPVYGPKSDYDAIRATELYHPSIVQLVSAMR
jgi:hypothetical protein